MTGHKFQVGQKVIKKTAPSIRSNLQSDEIYPPRRGVIKELKTSKNRLGRTMLLYIVEWSDSSVLSYPIAQHLLENGEKL